MNSLNPESLTIEDVKKLVSKGVIVPPSKISKGKLNLILKNGTYYKFSSYIYYPFYVIKYINKYYYLNHIDVEFGILNILKLKYKAFHKSPYSMSFYSNPDKKWGGDIENGIRISNHWNFPDRYMNYVHCETHEPVEYKSYNVGRFENGKYHIIDGVNQFINNRLVLNKQ
jgi:hypothetical protein